MIDYLVLSLFIIVALSGLISHVFGFPGNFIILAGSILLGWYGGFKEITVTILLILLGLALFAELVEFILGIGAFLGAFFGAFLVEFVLEKNVDRAMKSGWGAFIGRLAGTFFKGAIGVAMIVITIVYSVGN